MENLGFPFATLKVNSDKSVTRTQVTNDTGGLLQWVIVYMDKVVLERNASNEMKYKYYRSDPGVYTVYLVEAVEAVGGTYRVISNVVHYILP